MAEYSVDGASKFGRWYGLRLKNELLFTAILFTDIIW